MAATCTRTRKAISTTKRDVEPEKACDSHIDSAPALPLIQDNNENAKANRTTGKQNISEVLSGAEGDTLTKNSPILTPKEKLAHQPRKRLHSASPVSLKGPRKRTNEHPGLIGKKL